MPRLTELAQACGCAAKLSPQLLDAVLPHLRRSADPNLLVGYEGAEDAAVYRLGPETALVQTLDFFTPIVDDPEDFGAIAAANALSDVYAMGGRPLVALSVLGFPPAESPELLQRILQGGLEKLEEAGCALGGGHSVRDPELKFGYSVTGMVHPNRVLRNAGARPGDRLYLTKPLGTGLITTAIKRGQAAPEHAAAAIAAMRQLNRAAAEAALAAGAHAATDVTGFGLLGHARELALASGVHLRLRAAAWPLLPGALDYAAGGRSQGWENNRAFVSPSVAFAPEVPEDLIVVGFDPQTSGGLLISLPPHAAAGFPGVCIGEVEPSRPGPCLEVVV
ncbi:MAG: selenide, water dikinase SelD [Terriglobales bacterium]